MVEKNNEIEILDELLKHLLNIQFANLEEIRKVAIKSSEILKSESEFNFRAALYKLVKDEYVNKKSIEKLSTNINFLEVNHFYAISFEGIFFIKNGGYASQLDKNQKQQNLNDFLKSEQTRHSKILVRLNYWLVVGAILVAIDSVLNVLEFFGVYFDTSNFLFCVKPS